MSDCVAVNVAQPLPAGAMAFTILFVVPETTKETSRCSQHGWIAISIQTCPVIPMPPYEAYLSWPAVYIYA